MAWKPYQVLLVLLCRKDEDYDAPGRMLAGLAAAGSRAHFFDNVREPSPRHREVTVRVTGIAGDAGVPLLGMSARLAVAPPGRASSASRGFT